MQNRYNTFLLFIFSMLAVGCSTTPSSPLENPSRTQALNQKEQGTHSHSSVSTQKTSQVQVDSEKGIFPQPGEPEPDGS